MSSNIFRYNDVFVLIRRPRHLVTRSLEFPVWLHILPLWSTVVSRYNVEYLKKSRISRP